MWRPTAPASSPPAGQQMGLHVRHVPGRPYISGMVAFTYSTGAPPSPATPPTRQAAGSSAPAATCTATPPTILAAGEAHAGMASPSAPAWPEFLTIRRTPNLLRRPLRRRSLPPAPSPGGPVRRDPALPIAPVVDMPTIAGSRAISVSWSEPYYFGTTDLIDYTATATPEQPLGEPPKDKGRTQNVHRRSPAALLHRPRPGQRQLLPADRRRAQLRRHRPCRRSRPQPAETH